MISMIMATVGRKTEILDFLNSLCVQTVKDFEVIIVDQNPPGFLDEIFKISTPFKIRHILSEKKGLSVNRNLGLDAAEGSVVCFPDDDCTYYPNTVETVLNHLASGDCEVLMGRIWDRKSQSDIIKRWPTYEFYPSRKDLYKISSSITIFSKRTNIRFCEQIGAGAKFPSNEDFDYLARTFEEGCALKYVPKVELWHPQQTFLNIPLKKAFLYGVGFGFVCKSLSKINVYYLYLWCTAIGFHSFRILRGIAAFDIKMTRYSFAAFFGRVYGYFFA